MATKQLKKYVVRQGTHVHSDGRAYNKGDGVVSEKPLDLIFLEKFEKGIPATAEDKEASDAAPISTSVAIPLFKNADAQTTGSIQETTPANAAAAKSADTPPGGKPVDEPESEEVPPDVHGEDATVDFPDAAKADLKVFRKGPWYTVVDADEPNKALNDKGLKKSDVSPFLKKYLKQ